MSGFASSRNWDGSYFDSNSSLHLARYRITNSGGWTLYDGSTQIDSGNLILVSWPDYATIITFKFRSTGEIIYLAYPFGSFKQQNGPPSWPIIEYWAQ